MFDRMRQGQWSIQAQLLLYSLALLAPVLIFSALMFLRSATFERDSMRREITDVARSVAVSLDRELAATTTTLRALASSPSLAEGDLKAFYGQAMAAYEMGHNNFFLTDAKGKQLLNTRAPWGAPLPERSANDWSEVVEAAKPRVSNLYKGIMARGPAFSVSVPVMRRSKVRYVLSASISPARIYDILRSENLDKGWVASVGDRKGITVATTDDFQEQVGKPLQPDREHETQLSAGLWTTTNAQGVPILRASTHSRQSDWLVTLTLPLAVANQPMIRSWALVAVLGVSFVLLSLLLAYVLGRKISDPIRQLVASARALGRGEPVEPVQSSIVEVNAVGTAVANAAHTRLRMEQSLREGEDRLRLALRSADTGVWDWDLVTGKVTWDDRMRELWGLAPDDPLTSDTYLRALVARDRAPTSAAIEKAQDPDDRGEYDVEHRVKGVRDGKVRWVAARGRTQFTEDGVPVRMTGTARDITEHKQAEEHSHLLMRESTHRSKNLLAVIQAMARQSKVGSKTVADFEARFSGRLQALAASHDLLVQRDWHGVSVDALVKSQLGHYLDEKASQIEIDGSKIIVTPEAAQNIGLAVHELSTNAAKYGALSVPKGAVTVRWDCAGEDDKTMRFQMLWEERGGPTVTPPEHRGFGQIVTEQLAARALRGEAELQFKPSGVRWTLDIPASHVLWHNPDAD